MAFDGIVTKKIADELNNLIDYKIDKIYQPDKNTIILGLYGNFTNTAILACISANNYRLHLTNHMIKNPTIAPNFCMLLRKHILGYKIKKVYTKAMERIVYIELENQENIEKPVKKTVIVELMGKHGNIILIDENNLIIDAIRHTNTEKNAQRDIYPTARYLEPIINKINMFDIKDFTDFYQKLKLYGNNEEESVTQKIVDTFNGISFSNLQAIVDDIFNKKEESYMSEKLFVHKIYDNICEILNCRNLSIKITAMKNGLPKDFCLITDNNKKEFGLNFALDDYYFEKESGEIFLNYRNSILNLILGTLKKYEKRLENIDEKLEECNHMDKYKLYGELITANLYKIQKYNQNSILLENYYDDNKLIEIPLDKKYSVQYNAKKYYKKYNKLKNALEIVGMQKQNTLEEINYIESIIYELENSFNIENIQEIYEEISENDIFGNTHTNKKNKNKNTLKRPKKLTSNKLAPFNPLKYNIEGYTVFVGRNNKENDYLTNRFAAKNDIWLHTKDIHGSHVIIKDIKGEIIPENIIYEAAKLAVLHSKAKNSSKVPVDYCLAQFVKKVSGNKPGLVTYKNNKTIYV